LFFGGEKKAGKERKGGAKASLRGYGDRKKKSQLKGKKKKKKEKGEKMVKTPDVPFFQL